MNFKERLRIATERIADQEEAVTALEDILTTLGNNDKVNADRIIAHFRKDDVELCEHDLIFMATRIAFAQL